MLSSWCAIDVFHCFESAWIQCENSFGCDCRSLMHHGFHLQVALEILAFHHFFEPSEHMKFTCCKVRWLRWVCKTFRSHFLDCCNCWTGCHVVAKPLKSEVLVIYSWWLGKGEFGADLHKKYWSLLLPFPYNVPKLPHLHRRREWRWFLVLMVGCKIFSVLAPNYGTISCSTFLFQVVDPDFFSCNN